MTQTKRSFPIHMSSQSSRCKAYVLVNAFLVTVLLMTSAVNYLWTADILYRYELTNSSTKTQADLGPIRSNLLRHNEKVGPSKATNGGAMIPTHIQQGAQLEEHKENDEDIETPEDEGAVIPSAVADSSNASGLERQQGDKQEEPTSLRNEKSKTLESAGLEGHTNGQENGKQQDMTSEVPPPDTILAVENVYAEKMKKMNLALSSKHQEKFITNKSSLASRFPESKRVRVDTGEHATIKVNEEYAYVHIFKSGGTTIHLQTGRIEGYINDPEVENLKWFSFVRDPIDHFLSGWAECGDRTKTKSDKPYDTRILEWLEVTRTAGKFHCSMHSLPQANFLLNSNGELDKRVEFVGDLTEMAELLELTGFQYDPSRGEGRVASKNYFKLINYPTQKDLISDETMRKICNFVAIDYFLFDFEAPEVCRDVLS